MHSISTKSLSFYNLLLFLLTTTAVFAQDSSGVSCLYRSSFSWHYAWSVVVSENLAYVATGGTGLHVVDISNVSNPLEIGMYNANNYSNGIAVRGNYAYMTGLDNFQVLDVSNPGFPHLVGECVLPVDYYSADIEIVGNHAYVVSGANNGLRVINIENPSSPVVVGFLASSSNASKQSIAVYGNYILLTEVSNLRIINILNPTSPYEVASIPMSVSDIAVDSNFAYAVGSSLLKIIDITNPVQPSVVSTFNLQNTGFSIAVDADNAFVGGTGAGAGITTLRSINVSNHSNPIDRGFINSGAGYRIVNHGDNVLLANGFNFLDIIDKSNPDSLTLACRFGRTGTSYNVAAKDTIGFFDYGNGIINVLNISNPCQPRFIRTIDVSISTFDSFPKVRDIAIKGSFAYISSSSSFGEEPTTNVYTFRELCISNIDSMYFTGSIITVNNPLFKAGFSSDYIYLGKTDSLMIFHSQRLNWTQLVGTFPTNGTPSSFASLNNLLLAAVGANGLHILDVSNPTTPISVSTFDTPGIAHGVAVSGNNAIIADGVTGIRIINISNPFLPVEIGFFDTQGEANCVVAYQDYVLVADGVSGVRIINITNAHSPQEVGYYDTQGVAIDLSIMNRKVLLAEVLNYGIYDCSQALGVVDRVGTEVPHEFSLKPNYPNPFNATTTIEYTIPKTGKVDLKVFDITGRNVATLVNFHQNPGAYQVKFDGTSLSTGTYFLRLQSGEFTQTQKVVLLK